MEFFLTVNHLGVVSLWDTEDAVLRNAQIGESYVRMKLTAAQERAVRKAQLRATARGAGAVPQADGDHR